MKAKKSEKSKDRAILKYFTAATAEAVALPIKNISVDDLFLSIYIKNEDKDIDYLIKQYEKQILISKLDYARFSKELHKFYVDMADYIKSNGLYSKFFELSYISYIVFCKNKIKPKILSSYQNLLIQQFPYLSGSSKRVACGVDSKEKLITVPELYDYLTEINLEIHLMVLKNKPGILDHPAEMIKLFRKYRYKVNTIRECNEVIINDQISTTMLYLMAHFVTDETREMIAKPYRAAMSLVESNPIFEASECNDLIKEKLVERQFLLPSTGVNVQFANNGDVKELYLREVVKEKLVLLFRVKFTDGTYTSGYYNSEDRVFYDMWKESSHASITHIPLENIVLQNYLNLTSELTKEERQELVWFKEVKDIAMFNYNGSNPMVYYETKERNGSLKGEVTARHFDRSKYIAELMNIQPFLRRLPTGATVGEEAIEVAKKLGIDLPKGMTLVRGFSKQVYRNE